MLNQTTAQLRETGISRWSSHLGDLFNNQIATGLNALKPADDDTKVRNAIAECHEKANATIKFYRDLPEQLAAKLIAAGIPAALAHQTAESFAQRAGAQQNLAWATNANLACNSVTKLVDLLIKNPSKWKRDSEGQVRSTNQGFIDQLEAANRELHSAVKAINGG